MRRSMIEGRYPNSAASTKPGPDLYRPDDVIYIPVRVEETGQVLTRPPKKSTVKQSNSTPSYQRYDLSDPIPKSSYSYQTDKRYETKPSEMVPDARRRKKSAKGSSYGDDVEDALKRFDYLNDYSVEESSRSSRYALP